MAYHFKIHETVKTGVARIAQYQVNKAIDEIDNKDLDPHETVHQVRKRCKKLRGLIRLIRPAFSHYKEENIYFRDAARELSYIRDAQSIIESVDILSESAAGKVDHETLPLIRSQLTARRREITEDTELIDDKLEDFRRKMVDALERIDTWQVNGEGFEAIAPGLQKTYKRGRKGLLKAYDNPTKEQFHDWRKRVKYHWYHTRLLGDIWPDMMEVHRKSLDKLSDILGDEHDLAVLKETLEKEKDRFKDIKELERIFTVIDQRRAQLQQQAKALGELLYAEKKKHLASRFSSYWLSWRK